MLKNFENANPLGWTHLRLGEIWIYNEGMRSSLRNAELRGVAQEEEKAGAEIAIQAFCTLTKYSEDWRNYQRAFYHIDEST